MSEDKTMGITRRQFVASSTMLAAAAWSGKAHAKEASTYNTASQAVGGAPSRVESIPIRESTMRSLCCSPCVRPN